MLPVLLVACSSPDVHPPREAERTTVGALVFDGAPPRNLFLLSIDTLRRDHVDPLAADGATRMPFLGGLMEQGVLLTDHQQCSDWTLHSMTCTLLGRQTEELGWIARLDARRSPVPDGWDLLAVRLRAAGYDPLVASSNGWFSADWNSIQGYGPDLADGTDALGVGEDGLAGLHAELREHPDAPWFLHVHVKEPHDPYDPPEQYLAEDEALPPIPYDLGTADGMTALDDDWPTLPPDELALVERHVEARYSAEIRWMDDQLAELWAEMEAERLLDHTLVVVWNDHGESEFDHGPRGHGHSLYREENDGVLAFWAKDLRPARWTGPTHAIDLVPTVLAVLGIEPGDPLPGAVVGTAPADRARFTSADGFDGPVAAVTVSGQKLLYRADGSLERYDLEADPHEERDLFTPGDPEARALWDLLEPRVELLQGAVTDRALVLPEDP